MSLEKMLSLGGSQADLDIALEVCLGRLRGGAEAQERREDVLRAIDAGANPFALCTLESLPGEMVSCAERYLDPEKWEHSPEFIASIYARPGVGKLFANRVGGPGPTPAYIDTIYEAADAACREFGSMALFALNVPISGRRLILDVGLVMYLIMSGVKLPLSLPDTPVEQQFDLQKCYDKAVDLHGKMIDLRNVEIYQWASVVMESDVAGIVLSYCNWRNLLTRYLPGWYCFSEPSGRLCMIELRSVWTSPGRFYVPN